MKLIVGVSLEGDVEWCINHIRTVLSMAGVQEQLSRIAVVVRTGPAGELGPANHYQPQQAQQSSSSCHHWTYIKEYRLINHSHVINPGSEVIKNSHRVSEAEVAVIGSDPSELNNGLVYC